MKRSPFSLTLLTALAACGGIAESGNGDGGLPSGGSGGLPSGGSGGLPSGGSGGLPSGGSGGLPSGGSGGLPSGGGGVPAGGFGGTGASGVACDPLIPPANPGDCASSDPSNVCQVCVEVNCCAEYSSCIATNPDDSCGWGGPAGEGEAACIQSCVFDAQAAGGVADDATIASCAAACITPGCATISPQTNDLITCLQAVCFAECLQF